MNEAADFDHGLFLATARAYVGHADAGDEVESGRLLEELIGLCEQRMFLQLGRLTRELHDALSAFALDGRLSTLTEQDMPDARDRLRHVIALTDQAAHRTLSAVEAGMPLSQQLGRRALELGAGWLRFRRREMAPAEFRELSREIGEFLEEARDHARVMQDKLSEVLMAQDFQDLTGQIIHRVIALVQELEGNLVNLIRSTSRRVRADGVRAESALNGPQVPGRESTGALANQDDVDGLLSSLGF